MKKKRAIDPKPDGPYGEAGYCSLCHMAHDCDLYVLDGRVVCGDCRFFIRTGSPARRESNRAWVGMAKREALAIIEGDREYHGSTHTQGRFLPTEVISRRHAEVLLEIEAESKMSSID